MIKTYNWNALNEKQKKQLLARPSSDNSELLLQVDRIINQVKTAGDDALRQLTEQYDRAIVSNSLVTEQEYESAESNLNKDQINAIEVAIARITNYQKACYPKPISLDSKDGIVCSRVAVAIERVGLYVPGGTAPLVSTVMMLAIPAQLAGCTTRILCTPPNSQGDIDPLIIATAKRCGVDAIYKVGGAQAIAAMAYGTESIPQVDKIFGPGNSWVTAAKQLVAQDRNGAAIDMPAGPSEVLVIADKIANPDFVAADLLSQAEHGKDSQVILLTDDCKLAERAASCVKQQFEGLPRQEIIECALNNSRIIIVESLSRAIEISNVYAPEHLILQVEQAESLLSGVHNAGAVFIGPWTPESMGDYINGANHVLPTDGYATSVSGLSVVDFMKYISVQQVSKEGLSALGASAMTLAGIEGLEAHKQAIQIRLNQLGCQL